MNCNALIKFHDEMQSAFGSLDFPLVADGCIHRFRVPGDKSGSSNGWYVLHLDIIAHGVFGSWKTGCRYAWSSRKPTNMLEMQLLQRCHESVNQQEDTKHKQAKAEVRAQRAWEYAEPARPDHPYISHKRIKPYGLRQAADTLLVPLYDDGVLVSLQSIYPGGTKSFLYGGKTKGCYALIGSVEAGQPLYIAEGFATGATIHEVTGCAVACAMSANNLFDVGRKLQRLYPESILIIVADDDRKTESEGKGNPGIKAAINAASKLGCEMIRPEFPSDAPLELSDFNDLANWRSGQ